MRRAPAPKKRRPISAAAPACSSTIPSTIPNRKLVAFTRRIAVAANLPLQADLVQGYGDDSAEMQMNNGGTPTINLVVPVRYTHAHNGIVNRRDFDETVDLVVQMLLHLDAQTVAGHPRFLPKTAVTNSAQNHVPGKLSKLVRCSN